MTWNYNEEIIALKQNGLKSIFFILRKQQINTWYSNNLSTISHELTILGHKRALRMFSLLWECLGLAYIDAMVSVYLQYLR